MALYGVARHLAWGAVQGERFADEAAARARFAELEGGPCAAMLLGPDGRELQYYGLRAGRDAEMLEWWACQVQGAGDRSSMGLRAVQKAYPEGARPLRCLVIGAGARGHTYSDHPELRPVAVAEPNAARRAAFARRHGIPPEHQFASWEEAFAACKAGLAADVCMIATPDQAHRDPAVAACDHFRGLLLEKPMAVTESDCESIVAACKSRGTICAVCHVLRYTHANVKVRELIDAGEVGEVLAITHTEPVGYFHFAHSFVRGNWRSKAQSTNSLLAKCCHDVDLIASWMSRDRCVRVSSFGSLQHFRRDKQPPAAQGAQRCAGCPVHGSCPYSAPRLYLGEDGRSVNHGWAKHLVDGELDVESVAEALREGPYGRCVYQCDNDVCDHQVVSFEFASGATATLNMIATSERVCERETRVYGSLGELATSDPLTVRHKDFRTGEVKVHHAADAGPGAALAGHGGADQLLVDAFVRAVRAGDRGLVLTGPEESLRSHRLAFAADRARQARAVCEL